MAKESDAPIRLATASVVKALFVQSVKTKEETSSIAGKFGERVKAQVENGNLHTGAFNQAAAIFRKMRTNEIKAREHLAHLDHYLDIIREEMDNAGHVGDLDRMSKAAAEKQEEPQSAASAAAEAFAKEDAETEANRTEARKALDLDGEWEGAAPPAPPAEEAAAAPEAVSDKPKRGRKAKTPEPETAAAPPPPPPALKDDDEDEPSPTPRRQRGTGTFAVVH